MNDFYQFSASTKSKIYAFKILHSDNFLNCRKCGSTYLKKRFEDVDLAVEGKGKYPDILLCGHWPILVVSNKVLNYWKENDIKGFQSHSVRLFGKNEEELLQNETYYHNIVITGRCSLDLDAMGVEIISKCDTCGTVRYNKESWEFGIPVIKQNSWDGCDLFTSEQFINTPLCTLSNLELIHKYKLTNFSMKKIEDIFDYCADELNIKDLFTNNKSL